MNASVNVQMSTRVPRRKVLRPLLLLAMLLVNLAGVAGIGLTTPTAHGAAFGLTALATLLAALV